jgi:glycosyltransferase involved in cell wall biosynthesis
MSEGNPRPRIAILSPYPADFVSFTGGVETATAGLLEGFRAYQDEFEFHVVSAPQGLMDDLTVERDGFTFHFLSVPNKWWARPRFPWRVLRTYRWLERIRPNLIHCQDNIAMAVATIKSGYPRVFTVHGVKRREAAKRAGRERWAARFDALLEPYVHRHFDYFICISHYARSVVGTSRNTYVIPNAVRSTFFDVQRSPNPERPILLFVGVLSPLKGVADLLLAYRHLRPRFPELMTICCGEPEDSRYFRRLQGLVSDGVQFAGRVDMGALKHWLAVSTALVLPSYQENSPVVIAEAMAAGVPVVAARVGGVTEMVKHAETGLLYQPGDIDALAKYLEELLTNPLLCNHMGEHGRKRAQALYSPARVAEAMVTAYRQILGDKMATGSGKENE